MMKAAVRNVNEKIRKKLKGRLQLKLTFPVLLVVAATLLVMLLICMVYYQSTYQEREISNQRKQMDKVVYSISTMQNMVENVSKQIVVSEVVQGSIRTPIKPSAEYFVASDNIRSALGTYTFIMDYIQEILIYTKDGQSYSSSQFRDKFEPSQEQWYLDFKKTGEDKGYTKVHTATVTQNGRTKQVISYVLTYYSVSDYNEELGDLIISLDYAVIEKMANLDMSFLEGYAIYDKNGESVLQNGKIGKTYGEIRNISSQPVNQDNNQFTDQRGNIYLVSKELKNDWIMVTKISGNYLQRQILLVEILFILVFAALALLIVFALSKNIRKVVEPINRLSLAAEQFGQGNFDVAVNVSTGDEVEILANAFNKMVRDVQHYTEMSLEHEKIMRKSQVDQLLLQINPHFIYNTLNSIVYMARSNGDRDIEEFVNAFISLLQSTLHVENKIYMTLGEEIKNVENYLILQKYRYMDKFEEKINCSEELKAYLVPRVILQPIVENAIFHGIAPMEGKGKLVVSVEVIENKLRIVVADNGIGMSEEMIQRLLNEEFVGRGGMRKIGVANVYHRIKEICGEEYGFRVESREKSGTKVIIDLPLKVE